MANLQNWKRDSEMGTGWPVNGVTHNTQGMSIGDHVIYHRAGTVGTVKKSDGTRWGTFVATDDTEDKVVGTVEGTSWFFKITCLEDGSLRGDLFDAPVTTILPGSHHGQGSHHDHPHSGDDHDTDPTPGSWTTAEGGHTFEGPGRRRRRLEV